ncbi:uncharacterized protein KGF55_004084 [Candida pseudojiufengensis]|uniref:uncharacterized protein n=1 Tax=Candida pseudojiufengensis TaxID=497109 RepID=UPI002224B79A|nr:uncharacterized protein KGF55_004084 [Candida pseudojiufengensis]KAI5961461.1 hypothetical protein KGF55_004084 [Candida pseudojiufengensis]
MISKRILQSRSLSTTNITRSWFGDLFGSKKSKITKESRSDMITNQDELANKEITEIIHFTKENSPKILKSKELNKLNPENKVRDWKFTKSIKPNEIEDVYNDKSKLQNIFNKTYNELTNKEINFNEYSSINLHDLNFRFKFIKLLQSKLGFEINDYIISKNHSLDSLYFDIESFVNKRWKNERNPNAIVLRQEDFTAKNIYLNETKDDYEKLKEFNKIMKEIELMESR